MNKVSLISLALSFLFTIGSGFVPSVHSSDGDGGATENAAVSSNESSESTEAQSSSDEGTNDKKKDPNSKVTKKKKVRRAKGKRSKSAPGRIRSSHGNKITEDLNKVVLESILQNK